MASGYGVPGKRRARSSRFSWTSGKPGSVNQTLPGEDDLHEAYWNGGTVQDVGVQALTMWELRK